MSKHNESECGAIHVLLGFSITVIQENKGAEEFEKWFNKVFGRMHPNSKGDFALEHRIDDGERVLEITQYNPMFTTDSLLSLFESDRNKSQDSVFEQEGKSTA